MVIDFDAITVELTHTKLVLYYHPCNFTFVMNILQNKNAFH